MKRTESKSKRRRNAALLLLLLCIALGGPIGLGAFLLHAASAPEPLTVPGGESSHGLTAAESSRTVSSSGTVGSPLVRGMLYTNGPVRVNWSGLQLRVENSVYAYSGGELITTAPNAMGILKLNGGSVVFICPNSRVRLSEKSSGELLLEVVAGSSRFIFEKNDSFRVEVNNTTLSAAPGESSDTLALHTYIGEGVATEDGGCVLCNLSKNLSVSVDQRPTIMSAIAKGGQVVSVSGAGGGNSISSLNLPANVVAHMRAAMVSNGTKGLGYLCKCGEIKDYAERPGERLTGQPDLTLTPGLTQSEASPNGPTVDASPGLPQAPDSQPAVAPPPVPDVTVAHPAAPDPFVTGPLPASGEQQPQTDSDVIVSPPLIPGSGSGGGGIVSSS